MTLTAVSLFSGAGGFCEGARLAGWKVVCAVESDAQACLTHAANFGEVALFKGDIARFLQDAQTGVPSLAELVARKIDVVYGGPPCQGFSQIGPRNLDDPRNRLYEEFIRVVRLLKPRAFVMENVPNMVAMKNGHFRIKILDAFREAGYSRTVILPVVASDFGVPQHRRRVFVFGIRDRLPFAGEFAEIARALVEREKADTTVTVREALSDLPETVSQDDGPLAYPKKPGGRYSDFQKLMRLDWDHELLTSSRKRKNLSEDALHNHHTKGIEARRKKILAAIQPGARGDSADGAVRRFRGSAPFHPARRYRELAAISAWRRGLPAGSRARGPPRGGSAPTAPHSRASDAGPPALVLPPPMRSQSPRGCGARPFPPRSVQKTEDVAKASGA